jgi:hypothetical protein
MYAVDISELIHKNIFKNVAFLSFCGCFDKKMVSNNLVFHWHTLLWVKELTFQHAVIHFFDV